MNIPESISKLSIEFRKENRIQGIWDETRLIWKHNVQGIRIYAISNLVQTHNRLYPNDQLKQTLNDLIINSVMCLKCNKRIHIAKATYHGHKKHIYDKFSILKYNNELNYIEKYIGRDDYRAIRLMLPMIYLNDYENKGILNVNKRSIIHITDPYVTLHNINIEETKNHMHSLTLTNNRTKHDDFYEQLFINVDITPRDLKSYNPNIPDPYLLELLDGSLDQYNAFISALPYTHTFNLMYVRQCKYTHVYYEGNKQNQAIIEEMIMKMYELYVTVNYNGTHQKEEIEPCINIINMDICKSNKILTSRGKTSFIFNLSMNRIQKSTLQGTTIKLKLTNNKMPAVPYETYIKIVLDMAFHHVKK